MLYYCEGGQFGFQTVGLYIVPKAPTSEIRTLLNPIPLLVGLRHSLDFGSLDFRHSLYTIPHESNLPNKLVCSRLTMRREFLLSIWCHAFVALPFSKAFPESNNSFSSASPRPIKDSLGLHTREGMRRWVDIHTIVEPLNLEKLFISYVSLDFFVARTVNC